MAKFVGFEVKIRKYTAFFGARGTHFAPQAGKTERRSVAGCATTDAFQLSCGKGGGLNKSTSLIVHTRVVMPTAIAGVRDWAALSAVGAIFSEAEGRQKL